MSNPKFARVRAITQAVLKLQPGQPRFVYMIGPMYTGKKVEEKKDAATLLHAVDMETGEEGVIICPLVLQKELNEAYPGESYVGRGFEITKTRDPEKKYNHVSIAEVAIPDDFQRPPASAAMKASADEATATATAAGGKARK